MPLDTLLIQLHWV